MPLLLLFIIVPIIEISLFIRIGDHLGLLATLIIIISTAALGVKLLKQQGLKSWVSIQSNLSQGKIPAFELVQAMQLLLAGCLLLTPGFLTDIIGFTLLLPKVRQYLANLFIQRLSMTISPQQNTYTHQENYTHSETKNPSSNSVNHSRVIEGEYEEK